MELPLEVERLCLAVFWTWRNRTERATYDISSNNVLKCVDRSSAPGALADTFVMHMWHCIEIVCSLGPICTISTVHSMQVCLKDAGSVDVSDVLTGINESLEFSEPVDAFALGHGRLLVATGSQVQPHFWQKFTVDASTPLRGDVACAWGNDVLRGSVRQMKSRGSLPCR